MKKILVLSGFVALFNLSATAQYKRMFYKNVTVENDLMKITVDDAVATDKVCKFKCRIFNKSNDYLLIKPEEFVFKFKDHEAKPNKEKWLLIRPNEDGSRVVDIPGNHKDLAGYTLIVDGVSKIDPNKNGITTPDFKLPPSVNDFKTGNFTVTKMKMHKETDRTDVKFECVYSGDKIGIFEPNKVGLKMPDATEYANYHSDRKVLLFSRGDKDNFTVTFKDIPTKSGDMQFVEMLILWRDAFKESESVKVNPTEIKVEVDTALSDAKGK